MEPSEKKRENIVRFPESERLPYPVIGRIAKSDQPGEIMVEFDEYGPVRARLMADVNRQELSKKEYVGREVLLVFDRGLRERPIIMGRMENLMEELLNLEIHPDVNGEEKPSDALIDNERIVLDAKKEIVLRCGKGSITIKKDGKIVILGTNLISRSRGQNKIKGASVSIN